MDFLSILELLIGLAFIYFLLGLMATVVREIFANLLNLRAKNLEAWLKNAFGEGMKNELLKHKLIDGLTAKGRRASFYPTEVFVDALLNIVQKEKGKGPYNAETLRKAVKSSGLLGDDMKAIFLQYITDAEGDLEVFRKRIGDWFDEAMIRITGTYKKYARITIFWVGLLIVAAVNADTIGLARYFHDNPQQRKAMVDKIDLALASGELEALKSAYLLEGDTLLSDHSTPIDSLQAEIRVFHELNAELGTYELPLGWSKIEAWSAMEGGEKALWVLMKILGLLLSTLAVSLGAPFWYDMLSKLVNLRAAGNPPGKKAANKPNS